MTFTEEQQKKCRTAFIDDCRQKAWGARCHAEWIGKQTDGLMTQYEKLKSQDDALASEIKTLETAIDYHTVDNRQKRKELHERRNALVPVQNELVEAMRQAQAALQQLYANAEQSLALAAHAVGWSWKEAPAVSDPHEDDANHQKNSPKQSGKSDLMDRNTEDAEVIERHGGDHLS